MPIELLAFTSKGRSQPYICCVETIFAVWQCSGVKKRNHRNALTKKHDCE